MNLKLGIAVAVLSGLAGGAGVQLLARAPRVGYVDPTAALNQTADGKSLAAALNAFSAEKRAQVAAARTDVQRAKDAKKGADEIAALQAKADDLQSAADKEFAKRRDDGAARISAGLNRLIPKIRAEHGFAALQQTPVDVDPALDVTSELARRYDLGEGAAAPPPMASEEATRKIADLEKKVADMAARPPQPSPPVAANVKQGAKP